MKKKSTAGYLLMASSVIWMMLENNYTIFLIPSLFFLIGIGLVVRDAN
jgi:hypothetical protein